jgi:hypothetical protein
VVKGDNNSWIDSDRPGQQDLIGRLWLRVPSGGSVLAWLRIPRNAALLAAAGGFLALGSAAGRRVRRNRRHRRSPEAPPVRRAPPFAPLGRQAGPGILVSAGGPNQQKEDRPATAEILEVVRDGSFYGMQTFDQALLALVQQGLVELGEAQEAASDRHDFELALKQAGLLT